VEASQSKGLDPGVPETEGVEGRAVKKRGGTTAITPFSPSASFEAAAQAACFALSASRHTRLAYWADVRLWVRFCRDQGDDPWTPHPVTVTAWLASMQQGGHAPKTQMRRLSACSSVYDRIRKDFRNDKKRGELVNPFSVENGPKRSRAQAQRPTPIASPTDVAKLLASCCDDADGVGVRDEAIIRVLWTTGARRGSVASMSWERLSRERDGTFVATIIGKGGKESRILLHGKTAAALDRWLDQLRGAKLTTGGIWRTRSGAQLSDKEIWRMLRTRGKRAGVEGKIAPHMFRVAFLTLNPASVAAKQHAAGHADPATTMLYDRHEWRGREAFESMPDPEDL
jgi:site-specific recombinase XerD